MQCYRLLVFSSVLVSCTVTPSSGFPVTVVYSFAHIVSNTTNSTSGNSIQISTARNSFGNSSSQTQVQVETVSWQLSSVKWMLYNDSTSTTQGSTHKLSCTYDEMKKAGCLNEGDCFVLEFEIDHRMVACSCTSGWIGRRCELKDLPIDWLYGASTTGIVIIITIAVIAVFVFIVIICQKRLHRARLDTVQTRRSLIGDHVEARDSQTPIS